MFKMNNGQLSDKGLNQPSMKYGSTKISINDAMLQPVQLSMAAPVTIGTHAGVIWMA